MSSGAEPRRARKDQPFAADPDLNFWSPRPASFVAFWRERIPAGLQIPSRSLFKPEDLKDFLAYILVIDMDESRQRYRNRLVGTEITARAGRDATGKWLDEIYSPETLHGHHLAHQWVLEHRRPLRVHGTMDFVDRGYIAVEAAVVPLSVDQPDYIEQFMICVAYGDVQQD
ncbi:PAS domain-containing protein [Ferrovibrio terrae]|uniref:PAS domain-containing protein n=1 Tax=Ferrovibrio terrae TaxID=2594003 RepID=UPI0031378629